MWRTISRSSALVLVAILAAKVLAAPVTGPAIAENRAELEAEGTWTEPAAEPRNAAPKPTALALAMRAILDAESQSLATLQARFAAAADEKTALEAQREIQRVKSETEIALLRVQAAHARAAGKAQAAADIDAAIEAALQQAPRAASSPRAGH